VVVVVVALLLLLLRYNSDRVLTFSTISFHLRRSWTCSVHFISFIFFKSFLALSSQRDLGLHAGLPVNGFHLYILFTMLFSGILFMSSSLSFLKKSVQHLRDGTRLSTVRRNLALLMAKLGKFRMLDIYGR